MRGYSTIDSGHKQGCFVSEEGEKPSSGNKKAGFVSGCVLIFFEMEFQAERFGSAVEVDPFDILVVLPLGLFGK